MNTNRMKTLLTQSFMSICLFPVTIRLVPISVCCHCAITMNIHLDLLSAQLFLFGSWSFVCRPGFLSGCSAIPLPSQQLQSMLALGIFSTWSLSHDTLLLWATGIMTAVELVCMVDMQVPSNRRTITVNLHQPLVHSVWMLCYRQKRCTFLSPWASGTWMLLRVIFVDEKVLRICAHFVKLV